MPTILPLKFEHDLASWSQITIYSLPLLSRIVYSAVRKPRLKHPSPRPQVCTFLSGLFRLPAHVVLAYLPISSSWSLPRETCLPPLPVSTGEALSLSISLRCPSDLVSLAFALASPLPLSIPSIYVTATTLRTPCTSNTWLRSFCGTPMRRKSC